MIGPDRYNAMLGQRDVIGVADGGPVWSMMPDAADRLEAAIDESLADGARERFEAPDGWRPLPEGPCVHIPLGWLRGWLGDGRSQCSRRKWDWTKDRIVRLFDGEVVARYVSGGWGKVVARYDSPSSHGVTFEFLTHGEVAGLANAEAARIAREAVEKARIHREDMERREHDSLQGRGADAMSELGEILGVDPKTFLHPLRFHSNDDMRGMVDYLEDLRMAAGLMRFDLEASRREAGRGAGGDRDDAGCPPLEDDPDGGGLGDG